MDIQFREIKFEEREIVTEMIVSLYREDVGGSGISGDKISLTFETLSKHPDYGTILIIECDRKIVGYSLIINFWSNEYGGIIGNIDELYIIPEYRNRGIGTRFIRYLEESQFNNIVLLELQVLPYNARALNLYTNIGFKQSGRNHLLLDIKSVQ